MAPTLVTVWQETRFNKIKVQIFGFAKYRFFIFLDFFSSHSSTNLAVSKQHYCSLQGRKELEHPFQAISTIMKLVDFGEGRSAINQMFVGCWKQYFPWKGSSSCARTFLREPIDVIHCRAKGDGYLGYLVIVNLGLKYPWVVYTKICKYGPNVIKKKHRILVKDLISSNFLNANERKYGWSNSVRNIYVFFVQYFERNYLSSSGC